MTYLRESISRIEKLLSDKSISSATYAALEARLTLEKICYDRLRICHDYISHDELKKWQPKDVIQRLIQEVDENVASEFTFSISREPVEEREMTREDYEKLEFVPVGTQSGFSPQKVGSLWNALSRLALHVHMPNKKDEIVSEYGNNDEIRRKLDEALIELNRISNGNMISSGFGPEVHFTCECGHLNKRRERALSHGKVICCINPECIEAYTVEKEGDDYRFVRRKVELPCNCGKTSSFPLKPILDMAHEQVIKFECAACGEYPRFAWRLVPLQD